MKLKIYHNPRCGKSREALQYLQQKNLEFDTILYLQDTPTYDELKQIISKLNIKPLDLIRKKEKIFIETYNDMTLSDDEWIDIMIKNPILIERPIIVSDSGAVVGRPKERIDEIMS